MKRITVRLFPLLACAVVLAFSAGPAYAVDGVVLINQNTSINGLPGCGSAGFPIVICQPGSYRLAGDLVVPASTEGIIITANDVTLDFNGFSMIGPAVCTGDRPVCTGSSAVGVLAESDNVTVMNGTIRGMGFPSGIGGAVDLGNNSRIQHMRVVSNAGSTAIIIGDHSVVIDNTVNQNAGEGIFGRSGNIISGNTVNGNGENGINTAGAGGIGSTISGNTAVGNRLLGITTGNENLVAGNTAINNGEGGLGLTPDTGYKDNVLNNPNAFFGNVFAGVNMGHNVCGTALCP